MTLPSYDLRPCALSEVRHLFVDHHGYGGVGRVAVACYGVVEDGRLVAAYVWQPPPPGAARAVCPDAPWGVLALSRMVAVPREKRRLNHVSKPLRRIMRREVDRGRWPVLLTYSDAGMGHTGHVYVCSGWQRDGDQARRAFVDCGGVRRSTYANGITSRAGLTRIADTVLTRWVHRACPEGEEATWMAAHGWVREPVPGKRWRNGSQAYRVVRADDQPTLWEVA